MCGALGMQVYFNQFQRTPFGMLRLDPQVCSAGCAVQGLWLCIHIAGQACSPSSLHAAQDMSLQLMCFSGAFDLCCAPQDMGPGYRNVIGIPGGVRSPLFKVLQVQPLLLRCSGSAVVC